VTAFKTKPRYLRLLPGVLLVGGVLLVLNATGIVHDAIAQEAAPAVADAMGPAPRSANPDFAGGEGQTASAAEVDVLTSLSKRRAAIDAREVEVQTQTNILAATETRVDTKIAQLKDLQAQIAALLVQRDAAQEKQVQALMKIYSAMKPQSAAGIFNTLDDSVLLPVAEEMKSDTLAPILSAMNPDAARKLTVKLASKLALPDTAAAMAPPALVPALAGATQASAAPAVPGQTPAPGAAPGAAQPKS
jgi:flagellar motility protein MotE (MotC chaperone)